MKYQQLFLIFYYIGDFKIIKAVSKQALIAPNLIFNFIHLNILKLILNHKKYIYILSYFALSENPTYIFI